MAEMVKAWSKRTGEVLPNPVPKSWLDRGTFPNLAASQQAAAAAQKPSGGKSTGTDKKQEG